jgi:hypothetical protein
VVVISEESPISRTGIHRYKGVTVQSGHGTDCALPGDLPLAPSLPPHVADLAGAGAVDLCILAHRLCHHQGDPGEFAITASGCHGRLWADHTWSDIDPTGDVDKSVAGPVFCPAWVVTWQSRRAGAVTAAVVGPAPYSRSRSAPDRN